MVFLFSRKSCAATRNRWGARRAVAIAATVICIDTAAAAGSGSLLYDASLGVRPDQAPWSWSYLAYGTGTIGRFFEDASFVFDTGAFAAPGYAGYGRTAGTALDSAAGFSVEFTMRIGAESHANDNRSGFSLIVMDHSAKGIELSFWSNEVFAKNADEAFSHAESVSYDTQVERDYFLTFQSGHYSLASAGADTLTGSLRDYALVADPPFNVIPYGTPDYIFFGDNTSSASGRVHIRSLATTPVPEPAQWILVTAGLLVVVAAAKGRRRRLVLPR